MLISNPNDGLLGSRKIIKLSFGLFSLRAFYMKTNSYESNFNTDPGILLFSISIYFLHKPHYDVNYFAVGIEKLIIGLIQICESYNIETVLISGNLSSFGGTTSP